MGGSQRVTADAEQVLDRAVDGREALELPCGVEAAHLPFALSRRFVRDLGSVVGVTGPCGGRPRAPPRGRLVIRLLCHLRAQLDKALDIALTTGQFRPNVYRRAVILSCGGAVRRALMALRETGAADAPR